MNLFPVMFGELWLMFRLGTVGPQPDGQAFYGSDEHSGPSAYAVCNHVIHHLIHRCTWYPKRQPTLILCLLILFGGRITRYQSRPGQLLRPSLGLISWTKGTILMNEHHWG